MYIDPNGLFCILIDRKCQKIKGNCSLVMCAVRLCDVLYLDVGKHVTRRKYLNHKISIG